MSKPQEPQEPQEPQDHMIRVLQELRALIERQLEEKRHIDLKTLGVIIGFHSEMIERYLKELASEN
jgi:hypothetical protein